MARDFYLLLVDAFGSRRLSIAVIFRLESDLTATAANWNVTRASVSSTHSILETNHQTTDKRSVSRPRWRGKIHGSGLGDAASLSQIIERAQALSGALDVSARVLTTV